MSCVVSQTSNSCMTKCQGNGTNRIIIYSQVQVNFSRQQKTHGVRHCSGTLYFPVDSGGVMA